MTPIPKEPLSHKILSAFAASFVVATFVAVGASDMVPIRHKARTAEQYSAFAAAFARTRAIPGQGDCPGLAAFDAGSSDPCRVLTVEPRI